MYNKKTLGETFGQQHIFQFRILQKEKWEKKKNFKKCILLQFWPKLAHDPTIFGLKLLGNNKSSKSIKNKNTQSFYPFGEGTQYFSSKFVLIFCWDRVIQFVQSSNCTQIISNITNIIIFKFDRISILLSITIFFNNETHDRYLRCNWALQLNMINGEPNWGGFFQFLLI